MIIPMCILLVFSFMEADPYGGVDAGFTFKPISRSSTIVISTTYSSSTRYT